MRKRIILIFFFFFVFRLNNLCSKFDSRIISNPKINTNSPKIWQNIFGKIVFANVWIEPADIIVLMTALINHIIDKLSAANPFASRPMAHIIIQRFARIGLGLRLILPIE